MKIFLLVYIYNKARGGGSLQNIHVKKIPQNKHVTKKRGNKCEKGEGLQVQNVSMVG